MLFNSLPFLCFFPIVCIIYFIIPAIHGNKYRNFFLLFASYYFYMSWKAEYALLLLTSTLITYLGGLLIEKFHHPETKKIGIIVLSFTIMSNLSILFFFKYYEFAAENITNLMSLFGIRMYLPKLDVLLPVGISFYTFQALGYAIDVYKRKITAEKNIFTYALFVSFFPQLVAGPIERSTNLLHQFKDKHRFQYNMAMQGLWLMAWGYFMKMVLAERCAIYVDAVFNNLTHHNGGSFLLAAFLFSFQIYGDFAGYTFIAIGCARMMGFSLINNFMRPNLFSKNIHDFWKRWHISLTDWFREYLYFPLGGSKKGTFRKLFNNMVVFLVSGLWHGASWNFILWGGLHGMWMCAYALLNPNASSKKALRFLLPPSLDRTYMLVRQNLWYCKIKTFISCVLTTIGVCYIWISFRVHSLTDILNVYCSSITKLGMPFIDYDTLLTCFFAISVVFIKEYCEECNNKQFVFSNATRILCISAITIVIILFGVFDSSQFIYFQF